MEPISYYQLLCLKFMTGVDAIFPFPEENKNEKENRQEAEK